MPAYTPSPWQQKMHTLPQKRKWIWVGRRGGKGRSVLYETLSVIDTASKTPFIINGQDITDTLAPPIHVWVVAPN